MRSRRGTGAMSRTAALAVSAVLLVVAAVLPAAAADRAVTPAEEARLGSIRAAIKEKGASWTADYNSMTALSREEMARRLGGSRPAYIQAIFDTLRPNPADLARRYPASWDWRTLGGTTPV